MLNCLVLLGLSGVTLHFEAQKGMTKLAHFLMSIHNSSALLFVVAGICHLVFNWRMIAQYIVDKKNMAFTLRREFYVSLILVTGFVLLVSSHVLHVPTR